MSELWPRLRALGTAGVRLAKMEERFSLFEQRLTELLERTERLETLVAGEHSAMLHALVAEDSANRRRLWDMRAASSYEEAFTDPEPLVSVTVATHGRPDLLRDRALPSILAQDYERLEVIVVGDAAGEETREAVESVGDPRVRFHNLTQRILAHEEPERHWLVGGTMARNEAARMATGQWTVTFDDDDFMYPDSVSRLLALARERRAEVAYGRLRTVLRDGTDFELGDFPPRREQFSWIAAISHGGLRVFERELVAGALGVPGDWFLLERMLRAGVRFALLPELVADYFPSKG